METSTLQSMDKKNACAENPLRRKFVARQPIFDRHRKVVAYELLFRTGLENVFDIESDQDDASHHTLLNSFLLFNLKELSGGKRLFINFTRNLLLSDLAAAFPRDLLVVELLESIKPEAPVIAACKSLKQKGYQMALDDFVFDPDFLPLMEFMDIVKVDFLETRETDRGSIFRKVNRENIKFLAEKVETVEDFNQAVDLGYSYFQGFFFCRPTIVSSKDIPSVKQNLLKLLNRIYSPDADFSEIEAIIKKDVSLAYKLIRFINSAAFGLHVEVHSIMHVLNLLGINELKKWTSLVVLSQLSHDKPEALMTSSITRARFCELIAENVGLKDRSSEFFLMGLFSLIDAFFERSMENLMDELPLSTDIKLGLTKGEGLFGRILAFVECYEQGKWVSIFSISDRLNLCQERIPELYFEAVVWADAFSIPLDEPAES